MHTMNAGTSLLHLDSSADRFGGSVSRELTALFARIWRERRQAEHRPYRYRHRDLAADPVPPLDTAFCALGRRVEREGLCPPAGVPALVADPDEHRAWTLTAPLVEELLAADTVLIGAPMYNFSVSALLKAWIDRVVLPGALTDPASGQGRLRGTRVVVAASSGGSYRPGTPREPYDFQTPYLRALFTRLGVAEQDVHVVRAELTLSTLVPRLAEQRTRAARSLAEARERLAALAGAVKPTGTAGPADTGPGAGSGAAWTGPCGH